MIEQIFLTSVQFVSDNRHWILPGFFGLLLVAVVIDGISTYKKWDRLI